MTPNDYSFDYNEDNIGACLGFEGERASIITLGWTFMHGHDIIFDKGNQQIGLAVADCNRGNIENNNKQLNRNITSNKDNVESDIITNQDQNFNYKKKVLFK